MVAVLAILLAALAYAQTVDFLELVKTGKPQQIQAAINNGANVNAQGKDYRTPLMNAAEYNKNPEAIITALLKAGANVDARNKLLGSTALIYAAISNQNPEVITTLLKAGADIAARDKHGRTPLIAAAVYNTNPEVILTLLKAGADPKAKDDQLETAFDYARRNQKLYDTDAFWKLRDLQY